MEADPPGVEEQVPTLNTFTNMSTDDDLRGGIKDRNEIINKLWLRIENLETANKSLLDMLHGGLGELKTLLNKRE